uniref:Bm1336 n=1 Tax=Brugia malayi TaxID=6279 RepID=A0A0J9XVJ2_BRUMA|nr:Bm1336 [Brugia malayi]
MVVTMVIIQCLRDLLHLAVLPTVTENNQQIFNFWFRKYLAVPANISVTTS